MKIIATRDNWLDPDCGTHSDVEALLPVCSCCKQVCYDEYCDIDGRIFCSDCGEDYVRETYLLPNMYDAYEYADAQADTLKGGN